MRKCSSSFKMPRKFEECQVWNGSKGKLHSKIFVSDLVGFFMEFDGESPSAKFEQEHSQTDG